MSVRELTAQCTRIGAAVLPAVIAGSALVGCAWIVQSADAAAALAALVARVPRAIGPLVAGILVAARVGALLAGELGELRRGQQVDWLRAAGLSPLRQLVLPRLLAVVLVMPVATLVADAALLAGASLLAVQRGAAALAFAQLAPAAVWIGLAKAALFGATLTGVACAIGLGLRASDIPRL
ncbi:MAG: transporter permease, partial [Deltaproteobacteria bacterium]|nr:transporter permease [Deltaproteobacteria bacterium]